MQNAQRSLDQRLADDFAQEIQMKGAMQKQLADALQADRLKKVKIRHFMSQNQQLIDGR